MWWSWFACSADCHLRPGSSVEGFFSFQRNDLDLTFFDVVVAADDVRCKTDFTSSCKLRFFHRKRSSRVDEWGKKGIKRNLNFNRTLNSRKQHVSSAISTCFERDSDGEEWSRLFRGWSLCVAFRLKIIKRRYERLSFCLRCAFFSRKLI